MIEQTPQAAPISPISHTDLTGTMHTIQVAQLGLAAYVKMRGAELLGVQSRVFTFRSTKTTAQWRAEYTNSDCMLHDSLVCELRNFIKQA